MSLNNVDSSSGALVATGTDGVAISELIGSGDSSRATSIIGKFEFANINDPMLLFPDILVSREALKDGDNLVIVKDDNSIHEIVASGVIADTSVVYEDGDFTLGLGVGSYYGVSANIELVANQAKLTATGANGYISTGMEFIPGRSYTLQVINWTAPSPRVDIDINGVDGLGNANSALNGSYTFTAGSVSTVLNLYYLGGGAGSTATVDRISFIDNVTGQVIDYTEVYPYPSMDTSAITTGEIPSRTYRVDESVLINGTLATVKNDIYSFSGDIIPDTILNFNSEFTDNIDGWLKDGTGTISWEAANGGALLTDPSPASGYQYVDVVPGAEHSVVWYADVTLLQPQCHVYDTDDVTVLYSQATAVDGEFTGTFIPTGNKIRVITGGPGTAGYNTRIRYCRIIGPLSTQKLITTREFNDISISGEKFQATIGMSATGNKMTELSYDGHIVPGSGIIDLTIGQVAHYLLNNNADDSYGTYDGTPSGGVDFQGDVASFDGVDDYIDSGYKLNTSNSGTISAWVYITSNPSAFEYIVGSYDTDPNRLYLSIDSSGYFNGGVGSAASASTTAIPLNELVNVILKFTGGNAELYINSVSAHTFTYSGLGESLVNHYIGARNSNSVAEGFLDGRISNVRFYSDAKDQTFIDALYAEGYYPKPLPLPTTVGLIAHYPLTGTAEDSTGNYDGTENNIVYNDSDEFGSVASFNNSTSFIELLADGKDTGFDTQSFTLSVFMYSIEGGFEENNSIFSFDNTSAVAPYYSIHLRHQQSTGKLFFGTNYDGVYNNIEADVQTVYNKWVLVQLTVESGSQNLYADGTLIGSSTYTGTIIFYNQEVWVGKNLFSGQVMNGNLRNLRFYNRVLSTQELADIYNYEKNFRPIDIDDGLVAYYPLANNSLDNYYNEYDGVAGSIVFDGLSARATSSTGLIYTFDVQTQLPFTMGGWIYAPDNTASYVLCSDHNPGAAWPSVIIGSSGISLYNGSTNILSASYPFLAGWNHILLTSVGGSGGEVKYYRNGELLATEIPAGELRNETAEMTLLNEHGGILANTAVKASRFRVYSKILSAEQVKVIYNTEKGDFI